ncbi:MAG: thiamine diphosphokinase [Erysipelotrichaceae bacterium]|nr:thiamine diphosphokinase [Erysipelotrichaceae bacterium]
MRRAALITGGNKDTFRDIEKCDFIIACDKGYEYCLNNNIRPDLLIGDFDSYLGQIAEDISVIRLPVMKNDTDTMHAYREIVKMGFDEVYLYCALGGRFDHSYANIQCAIFGAKHDIDTVFINDDDHIIVTNKNKTVLARKDGYRFSLFAADRIDELSILNAKYEVHGITLENDFPLGQSNEWLDKDVTIVKGNGVLIIVESKCC